MYIGIGIKYSLFLSDYKEFFFSSLIFGKSSIIFYENLYSESRFIPCEKTGRRTDRHDKAANLFSSFSERAKKKFG